MDRIKPKSKVQAAKEDIKDILGFTKDLMQFESEDGSLVKVKPGIKKGGKVLKLELRYDKDFVEDDVHITIKAGCGEINLKSPAESDKFSASFCATKSF